MDTDTRSKILAAVAAAETSVLKAQARGEIETEPDLTNQLASAIRIEIERQGLEGRVHIRVLRAQGERSPERQFGADLCIVLHDQSEGAEVAKGVVVQAKVAGRQGVHNRDRDAHGNPQIEIGRRAADLVDQLKDMLKVTRDSYVFLYDKKKQEIATVPARAIVNKRGTAMTRRTGRRLESFFEDLLDCLVGDEDLDAIDDGTLLRQVRRTDARVGLLVTVQDGNDQRPQTQEPRINRRIRRPRRG